MEPQGGNWQDHTMPFCPFSSSTAPTASLPSPNFSVLLCYMPIDCSIEIAKSLSCQPQAQLLGFHSFLGRWINTHRYLLHNFYAVSGASAPGIDAEAAVDIVCTCTQYCSTTIAERCLENGEKLEVSRIRTCPKLSPLTLVFAIKVIHHRAATCFPFIFLITNGSWLLAVLSALTIPFLWRFHRHWPPTVSCAQTLFL